MSQKPNARAGVERQPCEGAARRPGTSSRTWPTDAASSAEAGPSSSDLGSALGVIEILDDETRGARRPAKSQPDRFGGDPSVAVGGNRDVAAARQPIDLRALAVAVDDHDLAYRQRGVKRQL